MAKLAKKYIAMAKKKVPPGQWQKRGLKTAWRLQKAGGKKGGGRKSPAKAPAKRKSNPRSGGNPTASNNKRPKIGASIQAFKGTQPLLSPVIDAALKEGATTETLQADLRPKANFGYAGNVAATGINQIVDRKIGQGAALSRGSITAWAPEVFAALRVSDQVKGQPARQAAKAANRKLALTLNGYDASAGRMNLANKDFRWYQGLKVGGGLARRLSNTGPFKRITAPAKKLLGELGGAL